MVEGHKPTQDASSLLFHGRICLKTCCWYLQLILLSNNTLGIKMESFYEVLNQLYRAALLEASSRHDRYNMITSHTSTQLFQIPFVLLPIPLNVPMLMVYEGRENCLLSRWPPFLKHPFGQRDTHRWAALKRESSFNHISEHRSRGEAPSINHDHWDDKQCVVSWSRDTGKGEINRCNWIHL